MSNQSSFLLMPNHSVVVDGETLRMESAEADMLRQVGEQFQQIAIASFVTYESNSSLAGMSNISELRLHHLSQFEHEGSRLKKLINYVYAILVLPFLVRRYDFIYIFSPGHCGLLAALWARILGKSYGLYVRNAWLNSRSETSWWWRFIFSGAKFMIVTGEAFKKRLLPYCRNVDNEVPLTALRPSQVSLEPNPDRSLNTFLFVGRLSESKGVFDAIRAIALLKAAGHFVELLIAGGGVEEEFLAIRKLQSELGVESQVRILGHMSPAELAKTYQKSGVFVFPSYFGEGFPRVLYEAMMYSLSIITCEMPGTEGFLVDSENCLYCNPRDPQHLASCMRKLLENPKFAKAIAERARVNVVHLYESFVDGSHPQQLLRLINDM